MTLIFLHPLVDFCSVAVLAAGGVTVERWLAYHVLAFALQMPLGVAFDFRPGWLRAGFAGGCSFVAVGCVAAAFGWTSWLPLVAASVGNALFHLTAGAFVLETSRGKSGPVGLFISTGALGLMAGQIVAKGGGRGATTLPVWAVAVIIGFAATLAVGAAWQTVRWGERADMMRLPRPGRGACGATGVRALPWMVTGLFALVVWRSWAGFCAGVMSSGVCAVFMLAGTAVTWAGKAAGGYAADLLGRLQFPDSTCRVNGNGIPCVFVVALSVVGSVVLCFACSPSHVALWLVFLFVAQLATGPVLSLMYEATGRRSGTAFGLNCLGLFAGSLI